LLVQAYAGARDGGTPHYFINEPLLEVPFYTMPPQCFPFGMASKGTKAADMGSSSSSPSGPHLGSGLALPSTGMYSFQTLKFSPITGITDGKTKPGAAPGPNPSGKATPKTSGCSFLNFRIPHANWVF
jgi:hypothetical protein